MKDSKLQKFIVLLVVVGSLVCFACLCLISAISVNKEKESSTKNVDPKDANVEIISVNKIQEEPNEEGLGGTFIPELEEDFVIENEEEKPEEVVFDQKNNIEFHVNNDVKTLKKIVVLHEDVASGYIYVDEVNNEITLFRSYYRAYSDGEYNIQLVFPDEIKKYELKIDGSIITIDGEITAEVEPFEKTNISQEEQQKEEEQFKVEMQEKTSTQTQSAQTESSTETALKELNFDYDKKLTVEEGETVYTSIDCSEDIKLEIRSSGNVTADFNNTDIAITGTGEGNGTVKVKVSAKGYKSSLVTIDVTVSKAEEVEEEDETDISSSGDFDETLRCKVNGTTKSYNAYDLICMVVTNEMGTSFNEEAIKAQAVAAYTYIKFNGTSASVLAKTASSARVNKAVKEVFGEALYYNGKLINAVYHSTSGGNTNAASEVWGVSYPYLVSADSHWDEDAPGYKSTKKYSADDFADMIWDYYGIDVYEYSDDPADWLSIENYTSGNYAGTVSIGGRTKGLSGSTYGSKTITGRSIREGLLSYGIKSHCFEYSADSDYVYFTVYGYGHGVGMSQYGAQLMAQDGYSYKEILKHYYTGVTIK